MSTAVTPTVRIQAFSPPLVNAGNVGVLLHLGGSFIVIQGAAGLMKSLGEDLSKAVKAPAIPVIDGKRRYPATRKSRGPGWHGGVRAKRVSPHEAKYRALIAEIAAQQMPLPFGFIASACRREGVVYAAFNTWRRQYAKRLAAVKTEAVSTVVPFSEPGVGATFLPSQNLAR